MTVFKTPAERRQWIDVRCTRIGERFSVECKRIGLNPADVRYVCTVELHKVGAYPRLACSLRADWLAVAGRQGLDLQYVLAGVPAADRADQADIDPAYAPPTSQPGAGGKDIHNAWVAAHRRGIGDRLNEECARLRLDLRPIEYLCTRDVKQLTDTPYEAGYVRADFLSLLADKGVDCRYVLTSQRSPNWPGNTPQTTASEG